MRLVFAGTPEFAARSLDALIAAGYSVVAVLTQPDRPVGRGFKVLPGPVKRAALASHVPVYQPERLDTPEVRNLLASFEADALVVCAYGMLLPAALLSIPRRGALNIHASLLPRWRGAAPIQRAIQAGDGQTGISIMQMDAGLDTGDVLLEQPCPILPMDTAHALHDRLADLGARTIIEALEKLEKGELKPVPQPREGVTYAHKVTKAETVLDWSRPATQLERDIRAFNPAPVSRTFFGGEMVKVWEAEVLPQDAANAAPGTVLSLDEKGISVACGENSRLLLKMLQRPGGKPLTAGEFVKGYPVAPGDRLGA